MKAISIVLVIITHCGWFNVDNYYPYTASHIKHPLMIFIVDMAVPIFMILSGFTYALSYEKKRSCYYRRWGIVKIVEYTIPMLFVIVENLAINRGRADSIATVIFLGKFGSGAYYFIVLISVVLFFPLIYTLMKDSLKGLIYVGLIQFFFEVLFHFYQWDVTYYRVCIFRYIIFIALGIYIYNEKKVSKSVLISSYLAGIFWLLSYNYLGYDLKLFTYWTWSSLPVATYIFPIVYCFLNFDLLKVPRGKLGEIIVFIGQKSYYIFAVQILYFSFPISKYLSESVGMIGAVFINCVICLGFGTLYYFLLCPLQKIIKSKLLG